MADKKGEEVITEFEKKAIEKYNATVKETVEREKRMHRHQLWRGNKLPPFNIEHMPNESQRLRGTGMTDADRALRKQWLSDQVLAADEPKSIAELKPRNPLRKLMAKPWDAFESLIRPVAGVTYASKIRFAVPKFLLGWGLFCAAWYNIKYNPAMWDSNSGWQLYGSRERYCPGDLNYPGKVKQLHEFNDRGFSQRRAFMD